MRGLRGLACPHEEARVSAVSHGVQLPRHRRERPTHGGDELQQWAQVLHPAARGTETRHGSSDMQTVGNCCSVLNMAARPVAPRHEYLREFEQFFGAYREGCADLGVDYKAMNTNSNLELALSRVPVPAQPVVLTARYLRLHPPLADGHCVAVGNRALRFALGPGSSHVGRRRLATHA